jgi:predicted MPP superfamily phosphohydrolase
MAASFLTLRSRGRGGQYSLARGVMESLLRVVYRGGWPARLWSLVPGSCTVRVIRHEAAIPQGDAPACRIAFVSDIHLGPTTPDRLLRNAFDLIRGAAPDVLLLGGDFVFLDPWPGALARLTALVRSVECPTKLAVLGNHDLWSDDRSIVEALQQAGAAVLVNRWVQLPDPWDDVAVVGLDDPWTGRPNADEAFSGLDPSWFRLILCHSPDGLLRSSLYRSDLYLCGHTHGGHVATPWGPIVVSHGALSRTFSSGFGQHGERKVFVSRGIGGIEVASRFFAPPDVLILNLVRSRGR